MGTSNDIRNRVKPGTLGELFSLYLQREMDSRSQGLGKEATSGDVELHDSTPTQPLDPKIAWKEAQGLYRYFPDLENQWIAIVPPGWHQFVNSLEPFAAIPLALGNFPQLIGNSASIFQAQDFLSAKPSFEKKEASKGMVDWANKEADPEIRLFSAGILRLAQDYSEAGKILESLSIDPVWMPLVENEKAALAWHEGYHSEALTIWNRLPISRPVLFNRAMATLFIGDPDEAGKLLQEVVAHFNEGDSWYHLAQLYLNLAEEQI